MSFFPEKYSSLEEGPLTYQHDGVNFFISRGEKDSNSTGFNPLTKKSFCIVLILIIGGLGVGILLAGYLGIEIPFGTPATHTSSKNDRNDVDSVRTTTVVDEGRVWADIANDQSNTGSIGSFIKNQKDLIESPSHESDSSVEENNHNYQDNKMSTILPFVKINEATPVKCINIKKDSGESDSSDEKIIGDSETSTLSMVEAAETSTVNIVDVEMKNDESHLSEEKIVSKEHPESPWDEIDESYNYSNYDYDDSYGEFNY